MQPFVLTAGSEEVNGTYSFAKQIAGVSEFWLVKQIKKRKKVLEKIYKIRGGGSLPQFGDPFNDCWVLQHTYATGATPIQYYAAPMNSVYDTSPPTTGWICIGGIEPTPRIQTVDLNDVRQKFDALKQEFDQVKETITKLKENKKNTPKNCPALASAITSLNTMRSTYDIYEYQLKCNDAMLKKAWDEIRSNLDSIAMQEFMYCRSADIYGGCAGLYDFGPTGAA
eukprot:305229_1